MTDIDPSADIELTAANEQVTARIPLAGQVTGEWLGCYHRLARAAAVPVRAETQPDRAWLTDLVEGGPETNSASALLSVGSGVWIYTIIPFTFLYWLLDGGGPEARIWHPRNSRTWRFPSTSTRVVAPPGWRPEFADYLGFTNATALSPTDVMPLARWSKLAMTIQAIGSLAVLGLVVARAVNILK